MMPIKGLRIANANGLTKNNVRWSDSPMSSKKYQALHKNKLTNAKFSYGESSLLYLAEVISIIENQDTPELSGFQPYDDRDALLHDGIKNINNEQRNIKNQIVKPFKTRLYKKGDLKMKENLNNMMLAKYKNMAYNKVLSYTGDKIKKHFGHEFTFLNNQDEMALDNVVEKFIKKYDNNFSDHVQKFGNSKNKLVNVQYIICLEKGTFAYVASGDKISDVEKRFLISSGIAPTDLYLYVFGKKMRKYKKEIDTIVHNTYSSSDLGIYNINCSDSSSRREDDKSESLSVSFDQMKPRSIETMFYSHGEKEEICNHIDRFLDLEDFYTEKQLLFKTGILLYGEPGTGKSSLIKSLATKYERSIANINVSNLSNIDLNRLTHSINIDTSCKYIILLEDIDTLFLNRNTDEIDKEDNAVINKLLQFLDSNTSPTNVIFIATTNHLERLDDALLREGRFDLKVEIKPLNKQEAIDFGISFGLSRGQMDEITSMLDREFPNCNTYNQSRLQTRILSKIEHKSTEDMIKIYGEMEDTSERDSSVDNKKDID